MTESAWRRLSKTLLEALDTTLRPWASQPIVDAFAAATRVYVELESGYCGTALTPRWLPWRPLPPATAEPRSQTPRSLARLVAKTENPLAAAFAVAAANAATAAWMLENPEAPGSGVKILRPGQSLAKALGIAPGDTVALLGYMPGLAEDIASTGAALTAADYDRGLLEEARRRGHRAVDAHDHRAVAELLEAATVVIFSGSALLDPPTLLEEAARARSAGARLLALVGATSSLHPGIVEKLGFDAEAGVLLEPSTCPRVRAAVAAGGGLHSARGRKPRWLWARTPSRLRAPAWPAAGRAGEA